MRKLIAGMQISLDGKITGESGVADWVDAWSDNYDVTPQVDACLLGAGMYPGYEQYWTAIKNAPTEPLPMTGKPATDDEVKWANFAARTPHYVLSTTLSSAAWPNTKLLRDTREVRALKSQPGKDIYLVGGARTVATLLDAGLVDEIRLAIHPLVAGQGLPLFAASARRRKLELLHVQKLAGGRLSLTYACGD